MSSWLRIYDNTSFSIHRQMETMARLQLMTASGSRIINASDDPADAQRIMHLRSSKNDWDLYSRNIDTVTLNLESASTALQEVSSALIRVKEVTTQAATGTYGDDIRKSLAEEIDSLLEQSFSLANYKSLGRHVFGGEAPDNIPYLAVRENGKIVGVTYQGSRRELQTPVAPGVTQSGTFVGDNVFRWDRREEPVIYGGTGAEIGIGTASIRGTTWMNVTHDATDYSAGAASGIVAGTSSGGSDSILGDHTIAIDSAAGTIRLNAGPAVAFAGESDLKLLDENGDTAYVDVSGYTPGWDGSFTITSGGSVSLNDAAPQAIDLAETNQRFTDSDGRVLYIDSTKFQRVGQDAIRVPGTYDLFGSLIHIRDVLQNTHGMSEQDRSDLLTGAIDSLEEVSNGIAQSMTVVGGRLQAADRLKSTVTALKDRASSEVANLENADLAQLAIDLSRTQTLYQATLAVASRILSLSLLDYIR